MEAFTIRRDRVASLGDPYLLALFDAAARRMGASDLIYPDGWKPWNTASWLISSPRALWLLAKARLIPLSEADALKAILRAGRTIEHPRPRVAKVQRVNIESSVALMRLRASQKRKSRPAPLPPAPPRTFTI